MPDVLHELTIDGTPDKVYEAITDGQKVTKWWAPEATAEPKVGSAAEFKFRGGQFVIRVEIAELESGRRVHWNVMGGLPEWAGTGVTWDLTPIEGGTRVAFGHRGHRSGGGMFASNSYT